MRVFIGSSSEQRSLVAWLTSFIRTEYPGQIEPVPWTIPWPGGSYTLEHLQRLVAQTDAAILFCTADDRTWYRGVDRHEPRDNLTFEAGLFLSSHGRERAQLMLPKYADARKVGIASDLSGLTVNYFDWADGPPEATGLPNTARTVCDQLAKLGSRHRPPTSLLHLQANSRVEQVETFVGDFFTVLNEGVVQLVQNSRPQNIDVVVAYRIGDIRRHLDEFKGRTDSRLRVCFGDMWDPDLVAVYRRKYFDRSMEQIQTGVKESIQGLLGECAWDLTDPLHPVAEIATPPNASFDVRFTSQRITYSYYRIDDVLFVIPLDMKKNQNPGPLAWSVARDTSPRTFEHYDQEFARLFEEARDVIRKRAP